MIRELKKHLYIVSYEFGFRKYINHEMRKKDYTHSLPQAHGSLELMLNRKELKSNWVTEAQRNGTYLMPNSQISNPWMLLRNN